MQCYHARASPLFVRLGSSSDPIRVISERGLYITIVKRAQHWPNRIRPLRKVVIRYERHYVCNLDLQLSPIVTYYRCIRKNTFLPIVRIPRLRHLGPYTDTLVQNVQLEFCPKSGKHYRPQIGNVCVLKM